MTRSKAFSQHQEERKQELLKEHGCYILKDIKGDITVNNPENYSVEYKVEDRFNIAHETIPFIINVIEKQNVLIINQEEKIKIITFNASNEIEKYKNEIKINQSIIDLYRPSYTIVKSIKENSNPIQKLLLRILGL